MSSDPNRQKTDTAMAQFFKSMHDELERNIGALEAINRSAFLPWVKDLVDWMKYILNHLSIHYELLERVLKETRKTTPELQHLEERMKEFDQHKPILRWIDDYQKRAVKEASSGQD